MKAEFRGRSYRVAAKRMRRYDGLTDFGSGPGPFDMHIRSSIKAAPLLLETLIHEALHACLPDIGEDAVGETALSVTKFLTQCGVAADPAVVMGRIGPCATD